jgi:DNA-binding HxlR family transcriptional regulator
MASNRIYPHFCMMARALEEVGERWSLLVVRDLMLGPRRFTDLRRSLAGITPTRLTNRLRSLEEAGIVSREPAETGREVWYSLTEAGQDLEPTVDALMLWGIEHALDPPSRGEPVHPDHVMIATKVLLRQFGKAPKDPVAWVWRFSENDSYTLRFDGSTWLVARGVVEPSSLIVQATPEAWARFITTPPKTRRLPREDIELVGAPSAAAQLARALGAELKSG